MFLPSLLLLQLSTMYGGTLLPSSPLLLQDANLLLAAFSNSIYTFSLSEGTPQNKHTNHDHPIKGLHLNRKNKTVVSIDQVGLAVERRIEQEGLSGESRQWSMLEGEAIAEVVSLQQGEGTDFYCQTESGKVFRNRDNSSILVYSDSSKILYLSSDYLVLREGDSKAVVISPASLEPLFEFSHSCELTTVEVYQTNLLLGDSAGKITILTGFLQGGEVKLRQKLQWHVHGITALKVEGSYLYSSGEEGVVVVWHLRENRRDFLPRLGTKILNFSVEESRIFCMLADNTIKSVDLGQDKALVHYRVIVGSKLDNISQLSSQKVRNSLLRTTALQNRLFMRSTPGKLQELNLANGLLQEHSIVTRNTISKLDNSFPSPHQLTDLCLSRDGSRLAVAVEGLNQRSLRFYEEGAEGYQLVSKVENVHEGTSSVKLVLLGDKFISYCCEDGAVKVWTSMMRRKESILQVQQKFWGCEYEIRYRSKKPLFVSVWELKVTVAFKNEFVVFDTQSRTIEAVYQTESEQSIIAIYRLKSKSAFLAVFNSSVQVLSFGSHGPEATTVLELGPETSLQVHNLSYHSEQQALALLLDTPDNQLVFVYRLGQEVQQFQIQTNDRSYLTDVCWLGERLLALSSDLLFYDLTHGSSLVKFGEGIIGMETIEKEESTGRAVDLEGLSHSYLSRQFRKDLGVLSSIGEVLGVSPSIGNAFGYLAGQLFL